jgi:hypothetical protein
MQMRCVTHSPRSEAADVRPGVTHKSPANLAGYGVRVTCAMQRSQRALAVPDKGDIAGDIAGKARAGFGPIGSLIVFDFAGPQRRTHAGAVPPSAITAETS